MSSDYSPFLPGPPIIHRDELPALPRPPAPDEDVSPHLPAARDLMVLSRLLGPLAGECVEIFPSDWVVTCADGRWTATLNPRLPLTEVEVELGYGRSITKTLRTDLLDAVRGRDELRAWP